MTETNHENQIEKIGIGFENKKTPLIKANKSNRKTASNKNVGIPKDVANRMARRIIFSSGLPTLSGMGVFIGSYVLVSKGIAEISPTLTLVSSAACFLVGLIGLSYGILSASWDLSKGSLLGIENIKPNIRRMKEAFKTSSVDKD